MRALPHLVVLVAVAYSAPAFAQDQVWLQDRRYGEGMGIRAGDLELHPGIAGEVGYDSNYFQGAGITGGGVDETEVSAMRLRVTPSLSLGTMGPQRQGDFPGATPPSVDFRATINGSYNEVIATDSKYSSQTAGQRNVSGDVGLQLDILPKNPWGADVGASYARAVTPSNDPSTNDAFNRDQINADAGVSWRPGGGLFDWRVGYGFGYQFFESTSQEGLDNTSHAVNMRGRWRFLPRTAVIYDGEASFITYAGAHNDLAPLRTRIGLNGLLTNSFGFLGIVGWGAIFSDGGTAAPPQEFDSVVGQLELTWFLTANPKTEPAQASQSVSSFKIGYMRDAEASLLGDYFQRDRGYAELSYFAGGVLLTSLTGGFSHVTRPEIFFPDGTQQSPGFGQNLLDVTAFVEYRLSDTFGINLTGKYNTALTDQPIFVTSGSPITDNLAFQRFEVYLGARWFM